MAKGDRDRAFKQEQSVGPANKKAAPAFARRGPYRRLAAYLVAQNPPSV